jgi:DNA-binding Xre family transcriptional regulator
MPQETKYKKYLKAKKLSQQAVADATNTTIGTINKFVNGYHNCTLARIKSLCKFHNCTPNDIIEFEPWLKPKK